MSQRFKLLFVTATSVLVVMLLVGTMVGRTASPPEDAYRHLAVFTEVLSRIKSDYVEEPDLKGVTLGAINGMLEAVDPFASYLSADQYKQWMKSKDVKHADVGLVLAKRYGYLGVVDAIPGSPAAKAGFNTGDMIESIKGVSARDMPLAYAELLLKGDAGTTIDMTVLRVRKPEPQKMTLTRAMVKLPPVASKMLDNGIGYVQVQSLETGKVAEVSAAVEGLKKQGAKKLILDLRDSAVSNVEEGVALADLFLDTGLITYVQGQRYNKQSFDAAPAKTISNLPMVVLTNRGTAGAAEVAAAALQDSKRAQVVGERTYGDAAMRKTVSMDDGSALILSVAKYYSPAGKSIQDNGVVPGVPYADAEPAPSETDDDTVEPAPPVQPKPGEDGMLKKAIEVLTTGAVQADTKSPGTTGLVTPEGVKPPPLVVEKP